MARTFGPAPTGVYVASIVVCSLAFGLMANRIYAALGSNIHAVLGSVTEVVPAWGEIGSAALPTLLSGSAPALQPWAVCGSPC